MKKLKTIPKPEYGDGTNRHVIRCVSVYYFLKYEVSSYLARDFCGNFSWSHPEFFNSIKIWFRNEVNDKKVLETVMGILNGKFLYICEPDDSVIGSGFLNSVFHEQHLVESTLFNVIDI